MSSAQAPGNLKSILCSSIFSFKKLGYNLFMIKHLLTKSLRLAITIFLLVILGLFFFSSAGWAQQTCTVTMNAAKNVTATFNLSIVSKYKCSGTACVQDSTGAYTTSNCDNQCFACQGALPDGATLCARDDIGLTNNATYYSTVAVCTADKKCEYYIACAGKCSTEYKYAYINPYYSLTSDCMNPVGELVHIEKCACTQGANTTRYPQFVTNCASVSPTLACSPPSSSIKIGATQQLEAMYDRDGSGTTTPQDVTASAVWSLKNGTTATVSSAGLVTGNSTGDNAVKATYLGLTADCNVAVTVVNKNARTYRSLPY